MKCLQCLVFLILNTILYWSVKCDCGNIISVQRGALVRSSQISCGCYNKNKDWRGCGDLSQTYWSKLISHAKKRGLVG